MPRRRALRAKTLQFLLPAFLVAVVLLVASIAYIKSSVAAQGSPMNVNAQSTAFTEKN